MSTQKYNYTVSNTTISNSNVYAILQGPRADATEALVLVGAWKNMDNEINTSGVALVLTLARYFKRWSLWSKDIIFLIPADSTIGPQAWVDAYHNGHNEDEVESLKIKSGALQGAVAIDYPAPPWGQRYDKLHVVYDGVNGQLPNLDLFNTAVAIAHGQMGIECVIQRMFGHGDSYKERLMTMMRGMMSQGLGHATGPHSSFIPYHVDAITLSTVGDGWHDEMTLGRTVESLFRSLNNLLEHLHQSFFFYLLLHSKRFVSIGTYLPSAMLIALNFSITALALWVKSGKPSTEDSKIAATKPKPAPLPKDAPSTTTSENSKAAAHNKAAPPSPKTPEMEVVKDSGSISLIPKSSTFITERSLLSPLLIVLTSHTLGLLPLYFFNTQDATYLPALHRTAANLSSILPFVFAWIFYYGPDHTIPSQTFTLIQCFSLLGLGLALTVLATLNFSLSVIVGVLAAPLSFVRKSKSTGWNVVQLALLAVLNPVMVAQWSTHLLGADLSEVLRLAAVGWKVWGLWTQVVVWVVWFPAWVVSATLVAGGMFAD